MNAWFEAAGAAAWGAVGFGGLSRWMDPPARARAERLCPSPTGVFVAAFPYYAGDDPGNLSRYARGEDYHAAVVRRLEQVCARLRARWPEHIFRPSADSSPIPERAAALCAGLGVLGDNGLVLLDKWGSWIFLGTILTNLTGYPWPEPVHLRRCVHCGACAAACPGGALEADGVRTDRCLSHLTQKTGELTPEEAALLSAHPLIWGCDVCQQVCPYNRAAPVTPLPEFRDDLVPALTLPDVAGQTRRQFLERYPGRAFTWRGPGPLQRNLELKDGE